MIKKPLNSRKRNLFANPLSITVLSSFAALMPLNIKAFSDGFCQIFKIRASAYFKNYVAKTSHGAASPKKKV